MSARTLAKRAGMPRYFGAPCKCGNHVRYTCNTKCVECELERGRASPNKEEKKRRAFRTTYIDRSCVAC